MPEDKSLETLADLFRAAKEAHGQAFADTNGDDPDWPSWYADYLLDPLTKQLNIALSETDLVSLLTQADKDLRLHEPEADWAGYYARYFTERYT